MELTDVYWIHGGKDEYVYRMGFQGAAALVGRGEYFLDQEMDKKNGGMAGKARSKKGEYR